MVNQLCLPVRNDAFAACLNTPAKQLLCSLILLFSATSPVKAGEPEPCPKTLAPAVESKLLKVLDALAIAQKKNDWFDSGYSTAFDELMSATDKDSQAARVALMDYYVGESTGESLVCAVALDGKQMKKLLQLHTRCDIRPSRSPIERNRSLPLRKYALEIIARGNAKAHCTYE